VDVWRISLAEVMSSLPSAILTRVTASQARASHGEGDVPVPGLVDEDLVAVKVGSLEGSECDHCCEAHGYQSSDRLHHLVQIRRRKLHVAILRPGRPRVGPSAHGTVQKSRFIL
jgi:hypothetical protein